jgi:hypothetical protein
MEQRSHVMSSSEQQTSTPVSMTEWATGMKLKDLIILIDRENCFETTLIHLTERFNGKDVYLVGTSNQSTMLAQRTKKLIEEIKPDTVLVQANQQ